MPPGSEPSLSAFRAIGSAGEQHTFVDEAAQEVRGVPTGDASVPAALVAFGHTPILAIATFAWFFAIWDTYPEPTLTHLLMMLPAAFVGAVVSGLHLVVRRVIRPFLISTMAAFSAAFCAAMAIDLVIQTSDSEYFILCGLLLPTLLVFAALQSGRRLARGRERKEPFAAFVAAVVLLFLSDWTVRYIEAQSEQSRAAEALSGYETTMVLDAPGWRLVHAYDESAFPELVYRDLRGRTVLLGSTPGATVEDAPDGESPQELVDPTQCGRTTEAKGWPNEEACTVRNGLLMVEAEAIPRDRLMRDHADRWPDGWTEVRMQSDDGRYVRLRSDSEGADLLALAESIEEDPTDPASIVRGASCTLHYPVWRNYFP